MEKLLCRVLRKHTLRSHSLLCVKNTHTRKFEFTVCRGQPRGPPKKPGGGASCLRHAKNKTKHTSSLTRNTHTRHGPRCGGPRGPPRRPSKTPPRARSASLEGLRSLERSLPRSRVHSTLERAPPRSRAPASPERAPPRSRLPHKRTCSRTRVRAFNAPTQQSRAITRLGITPRRYFANSLGEAHPRHCGGLCDEAGVSSVTLCRPL
jgi:hypothetical protein